MKPFKQFILYGLITLGIIVQCNKTAKCQNDTITYFEYSYEIKTQMYWHLSSIPEKQTEIGIFPETRFPDTLVMGYNRANICWFSIDPLFFDDNGLRPPNIDLNELSDHYVRQVWEEELFNYNIVNLSQYPVSIWNIRFYPSERGPFNYDTQGIPGISAGISEDGKLKNPETRWGGIMKKLEITDFESENVQYLSFWLMDPFIYSQTCGGNLYINLGDISEDVMKDSRKMFENGLPVTPTDENTEITPWGIVPTIPATIDNFDPTVPREYQDVGLDGLKNEDEMSFFQSYLQEIGNLYGSESNAFIQASNDPSHDNYHYFRGNDYDTTLAYSSILERYRYYNGTERNSINVEGYSTCYPTYSSLCPDVEDINSNQVLDTAENYYQYKIELVPDKMNVGENFISQIHHTSNIQLPNGTVDAINWYQFKVPVHEYSDVIGTISGFSSIRFIRLFLKNFTEPVVLRFATFELVRIKKNPENLYFTICPNPVKNYLRILFPEPVRKSFYLAIINMHGILQFEKYYPLDTYGYLTVSVTDIESGLYFLRLSNSMYKSVKKIVVSK